MWNIKKHSWFLTFIVSGISIWWYSSRTLSVYVLLASGWSHPHINCRLFIISIQIDNSHLYSLPSFRYMYLSQKYVQDLALDSLENFSIFQCFPFTFIEILQMLFYLQGTHKSLLLLERLSIKFSPDYSLLFFRFLKERLLCHSNTYQVYHFYSVIFNIIYHYLSSYIH